MCRFDEFWEAYPKREGDSCKADARKKFQALVKSGVDPDRIIAGARASASHHRARGTDGTRFVPQAPTWLNGRRWEDGEATAEAQAKAKAAIEKLFYAKMDSPQLAAWDAHSQRTRGTGMMRDKNGGWYVPTEWPPGYQPQQLQAAE